jgi:hypothetical protein
MFVKQSHIQGMQKAAHTSLFQQVFKKEFHSMAAYSSDAESKKII